MTLTLTFLDKGKIGPPDSQEENYVTYTTPSKEDREWSLSINVTSHNQVYVSWIFVDDETAREEYPIFREIAMRRNWAPMENLENVSSYKRPCPHLNTKLIGIDRNFNYAIDRCLDCDQMLKTVR